MNISKHYKILPKLFPILFNVFYQVFSISEILDGMHKTKQKLSGSASIFCTGKPEQNLIICIV